MDKVQKPRKLMTINRSKYEASEAIHENKKYWKSVLKEVHAKHEAPKEITESRHIKDVLPSHLFKKVCECLEIPESDETIDKPKYSAEKPPRRKQKAPFITYRTQLHIDREMDSDTDVEYSSSEEEEEVPNCHYELLQKPVREQITWETRFLGPEEEHEKNLVTKSDDVTDRIAREFCQYMTELGGNQQSQLFTPHAIKELFQVEFNTHIARGLRVVPKEIPTVIENIAAAAESPEKSILTALKQEVSRDIKVESRPTKKTAFGTNLPSRQQWYNPNNNTKNVWRSSRYIPKDLVSLKTVWEGITNIRSVREYCRWMIDHPEHRRAPYLRSLGMFDAAVLQARTTFDLSNKDFTHLRHDDDAAPPLENLRKRLSNLTEFPAKSDK